MYKYCVRCRFQLMGVRTSCVICPFHSQVRRSECSSSHFHYVLRSGGESYKRGCTSFKGTIAIHRTLGQYLGVSTINSAVRG